MAKTKEQKQLEAEIKVTENMTQETIQEVSKDTVSKEPTQATQPAQKSGPTYEELIALVQQLAGEVQSLKSGNAPTQTAPVQSNDKTDKILELLANRKSDREVVIIHNCEMLGGSSTHIELTGLTIDFHALGEQRLLSWQQFEECVSKYRTFFERQIILLSDTEEELAKRYSIPCVKRGNNRSLTHDDIIKLPNLEPRALEDFVQSLTEADKEFVFSYWLGKCYNKASGFYDRYKIEMLNNLSKGRVFDNLLTLMNGDFRNEQNN